MISKNPICPSCKNGKKKSDTVFVQRTIRSLFEEQEGWTNFFYSGDRALAYKNLTAGDGWACDSCIESGMALQANPTEQEFCDWPPFLAYVDSENICETCQVEFVFSKIEKKYWFETLKFWVQSEAVNCKICRAKKRERKVRIKQAQACLADLLPKLNRKDEAQLQELICAYSKMESVKKVKEYSDILKKLRAAYDIK